MIAPCLFVVLVDGSNDVFLEGDAQLGGVDLGLPVDVVGDFILDMRHTLKVADYASICGVGW